ncbi:MAG: hypothetical protein OEV95_08925 [Gemmatimonadota bacterium]|nr:hypothetical protein [Gemmatimonadota bacterium]MDH5282868.1 hypothetical protein [Gemmatimonadota bacterium]
MRQAGGAWIALALGCAATVACQAGDRRTAAAARDSSPAMSTPTAAAAGSDTADPPDPRGQRPLSIALSSEGGGGLGEFPATLLLRDPQGRRTGFDIASGTMLREIPGAWDDDEVIEDPETEGSGTATRVLEITAPEPGAYLLTVAGTAHGTYQLSVRGYDASWEPSSRVLHGVAIEAGETHGYAITFDRASGITVERRP